MRVEADWKMGVLSVDIRVPGNTNIRASVQVRIMFGPIFVVLEALLYQKSKKYLWASSSV